MSLRGLRPSSRKHKSTDFKLSAVKHYLTTDKTQEEICEISRKIFITIDEKGNIVKDVNANKLTKIISEPVREQCNKIFNQIQERFSSFYASISDELEDEDEEKKNLDIETDRFEHATNKVIEIARLKNDNNEFVKGLIAPLTI